MDNDARYIPVAQALPAQLPALDRKTGLRYATALVKHFGRMGLGSPNQQGPAALWQWQWHGGRRVWVSPRPTSGHHKGWGRLIHDVSHLVFAKRHPSFGPHDGGHATLEAEMAAYVVAKGWLAERKKLVPVARSVVHHERAKRNLARWETKLKRATNAIRKLRRAISRHERRSS